MCDFAESELGSLWRRVNTTRESIPSIAGVKPKRRGLIIYAADATSTRIVADCALYPAVFETKGIFRM